MLLVTRPTVFSVSGHVIGHSLTQLSGGKWGLLSELLRAVLCTTVVHNDMHTDMSSS